MRRPDHDRRGRPDDGSRGARGRPERFVQDATAGIAIYLDAPFDIPVAAGSRIRVRAPSTAGSANAHFGSTARTSPCSASSGCRRHSRCRRAPPPSRSRAFGSSFEGPSPKPRRAQRRARPDDRRRLGRGAGDRRAGRAGWSRSGPGSIVVARGPLGQRDSSGTGIEGYRLHATLAGELDVQPPPTPCRRLRPSSPSRRTAVPTPTIEASPTAAPSPSASPSPTPSPAGPSASPTPRRRSRSRRLASAPIGTTVFVRGVVVAEAGQARHAAAPRHRRCDRRDPGQAARRRRGAGARHAARGPRRPRRSVRPGGAAPAERRDRRRRDRGRRPAAIALSAGAVGEPNEGRLARVSGTIDGSASKSTSNDLTFSITGTDGATLRILADASAGLDAGLFRKGAGVSLTGIVGQRASRKGALDGYRLWLRDRGDVVITAQPAPTPSATPRGGPTPKPSNGAPKPSLMSVRAALRARRPAGDRSRARSRSARACSTPAAAGRSSRTAPPRSRSTSPPRTPRCGSGHGSG